jgi:hypothetical protein
MGAHPYITLLDLLRLSMYIPGISAASVSVQLIVSIGVQYGHSVAVIARPGDRLASVVSLGIRRDFPRVDLQPLVTR